MIVIGINQGMQPIIGYNYGSKNYASVITSVIFILGCFISDVLVRAI